MFTNPYAIEANARDYRNERMAHAQRENLIAESGIRRPRFAALHALIGRVRFERVRREVEAPAWRLAAPASCLDGEC